MCKFVMLGLLSWAALATGCATPSTISSKPVAPPAIPAPPAAIYDGELKPSGHFSKTLTDWREQAQRKLTGSETSSGSAAATAPR